MEKTPPVSLGRHYERIWKEVERFVVSYIRAYRRTSIDESTGKKVATLEIDNIRDFYYAVVCLRKIQEGRQAAVALEVKHSDGQHDSSTHLDMFQKEISRVLEQLQENGNNSTDAEDSVQD